MFFSALCAMMAMMLMSCTDNKELLANMVGTYCDNDPESATTLQFYPSTDGHTGRFVEKTDFIVSDPDEDGIETNVHANVYITGTYTLTDERRLSYKYDTDEIVVRYDNDDLAAYADRNIEFNNANNDVHKIKDMSKEDVMAALESFLREADIKIWTEVYTDENKDFETQSYSDVQCDGKTFSFHAGDGRVTYTREAEDMFEADLFDESEEAAPEAEEAQAEEPAAE